MRAPVLLACLALVGCAYAAVERIHKHRRPHHPVTVPEVFQVEDTNDVKAHLAQGSVRVEEAGPVCNLTGIWRNHHGSEMYLKIHKHDRISGLYRTTIETKPGASGNGGANRVEGSKSNELITFHVVWGGGESIATWVGQCFCEPDSSTVLHTSWMLVSKASQIQHHWMMNRFGQDTFVKQPDTIERESASEENTVQQQP